MQKPGQQQCVHAYLVQLLDPDFEVFIKSCNFAVVEGKQSIISAMNEYSLPCLVIDEAQKDTPDADEEDLKNMRCNNVDELADYIQLMLETGEKMKQRC